MKCGSTEEAAILRWVVREAKRLAHAEKVLLFGSRARGDAGDLSDFDIAIETHVPSHLALLKAVLDENPLTLLAFDVVDLTRIDHDFRARIMAEGKDITDL